MQNISVIIADDHEIVRGGISAILNKEPHINLVAEADNGEHLLELVARHMPDVVLIDIKMPVLNGLDATKLLAEKYPGVGVIALSMADNSQAIQDMTRCGAKGYLLKSVPRKELIAAIEDVSQNRSYYCRESARIMAGSIHRKENDDPAIIDALTVREKQVLRLICRELSTRQIAAKLFTGIRTIEKDREHLLEKTGAHNTAGLVVFAMRNGLHL